MIDLSVLIPARGEEFLGRTIQDLLEHIEGKTEIIVILDGYLPDPPLQSDPRVTIIYHPESVGQRKATNDAAKLAKGKYLMKVDAHCAFDQGFDVKMLDAFKETGDNVTMIPQMKNLHAFDWVCKNGHRRYQSPSGPCEVCKEPTTKDVVWIVKHNPTSITYRFDRTLHFQYYKDLNKKQPNGIVVGYNLSFDNRSVPLGVINLLTDFANSHQLTCRRNSDWFRQNVSVNTMGLSSVDNGGSVGAVEVLGVGNKSQMEGITTPPVITDMVDNHNLSTSAPGNTFNKPSISDTMCECFLSEWGASSITTIVDSSMPVPATSYRVNSDIVNKLNNLLGGEFINSEKTNTFHNGSVTLTVVYDKDIVETLSIQGSCFMCTKEKFFELELCGEDFNSWGQQGVEVACKTWLSGGRVLVNKRTWYCHMFRTRGGDFGFPYHNPESKINENRELSRKLFQQDNWPKAIHKFQWLLDKFAPIPDWEVSKGAIFYTDSQLDERIAKPVREQILKVTKEKNISVVSASLKKMSFGIENIHFPTQKRGYATMFKQIMAALEHSEDDYIFFLEHDVWYSPTHFDFTPPDKNIFYFNNNVWKVDLATGKAVKVDKCEQLSGMCVYRETALKWVREKYNQIISSGFDRHFEPQNTVRGGWESQQPNIDIRHSGTFTPSRWSKEEFRNQENTKGWTESENELPGWGDIRPILDSMR